MHQKSGSLCKGFCENRIRHGRAAELCQVIPKFVVARPLHVTGILSVMAGFMLAAHPEAGNWALAMILPIWIIAHCISRLSHLQYMKMHYGMTYYTISLILNILGLLVGILLIFRPMITILSMGVLVGGFMIIEGVELILVGLDGRQYYR